MSELKLSKQGQELIKLYEQMAEEGYKRNDGIDVKNAFSDFELRKFRDLCKEKISQNEIKSLLDLNCISNSSNPIPSPDIKSAIPCKDASVKILVKTGNSFNLKS